MPFTLSWSSVFTGLLLFVYEVYTDSKHSGTVARPAYGVQFDKIGTVIDAGSSMNVHHLWSIDIPQYTIPRIEQLDCDYLASIDVFLRSSCITLNTAITEAHTTQVRLVQEARSRLINALNLIPTTDPTQLYAHDNGGVPTQHELWIMGTDPLQTSHKGREKRQVHQFESFTEILSDFLPTHILGDYFNNMFDVPGPHEIKQMKRNLREIANAQDANKNIIMQLQNYVATVADCSDKRIQGLHDEAHVLGLKLNRIRADITTFIANTGDMLNKTESSAHIAAMFIQNIFMGHLYPTLTDIWDTTNRAIGIMDRWSVGIGQLIRGQLSPLIIPTEMMQEALQAVQKLIADNSKLSSFKLITTDPQRYYELPNAIIYVRTEHKLSITLKVPLQQQQIMPLYQVHKYAIPVMMGLANSGAAGTDKGYTIIDNTMDYIIVSEDSGHYVELTLPEFTACRDIVDRVYSCGKIVSVLKQRSPTDITCTYAIFTNNILAARKVCSFLYDDHPPVTTVLQLPSDHSYLVNSGGDRHTWELHCPHISSHAVQYLRSCDMCHLTWPCGCYLVGQYFSIPPHLSGCFINETDSNPRITRLYSRNVAPLLTLNDDALLENYHRYHDRVSNLFTPQAVPQLQFTNDDKFQTHISAHQYYKVNYTRALKRMHENVTAYRTKVDEMYAKATDMTDVVIETAAGPYEGVKALFSGWFGGKIWAILAAIFGPFGLMCMTFIIAIISASPRLYRTCRKRCKRRATETPIELQHLLLESKLPPPPPYTP